MVSQTYILRPRSLRCLLFQQLQVTVAKLQRHRKPSAKSIAAVSSSSSLPSADAIVIDHSSLLQSLHWVPGIRVTAHCRFPLLIIPEHLREQAAHRRPVASLASFLDGNDLSASGDNIGGPRLRTMKSSLASEQSAHWHWPHAVAFAAQQRIVFGDGSSLSSELSSISESSTLSHRTHLQSGASATISNAAVSTAISFRSSMASSASSPICDPDRIISDSSQTKTLTSHATSSSFDRTNEGGRKEERELATLARGFPVTVVLDHRFDATESCLFSRLNSDPAFTSATLAVHREMVHRGMDIASGEWGEDQKV